MGACSRKKDKFVNRNFHAMATRYNILYNGYLALEAGKVELAATYQDNYWDILPIERMQEKDEVLLPGQQKNSNFEKAEEKAAKAVQKHAMNIKGREKNYQIDEAYILLGEARYYEQRMIPALEAFNYVLNKYPNSSKIVEAKIWREKVNMRLDNNELALVNLKKVLKGYTLEDQEQADMRAMMAEAYINLKFYDSAATSLGIAAKFTKNNDEKGRYLFILGQLYNKLGKVAKADACFDKVIDLNRRSPRIYMINAYMQKSRNFNWEKGDKVALLEMLKKLEKNRENRPFLDLIYHEIGNYYLHEGPTELAAKYYNMSLRKPGTDQYLRALNYDQLAEMAFNKVIYKTAGKYYDSTLLNLKENSKMYRAVKKKKDNLADVVYYEDIAQHNDSILKLVSMSESERTIYFTGVIDSLAAAKKADEEKKEKEALAAANAGKGGKNGGTASSFYFYNASTVTYGKTEFKKQWGDRKLEDDWRLSDKTTVTEEEVAAKPGTVSTIGAQQAGAVVTVDDYLKTVPDKAEVIDSIRGVRNYAYYQLGIIYFSKFKEYRLAADRLEWLLAHNPEENLIVPAKYNLYKIYLQLNPQKAEAIKLGIIQKYPDSRYALLLQNPYAEIKDDENSPDMAMSFYNKAFENQEYGLLLAGIDEDIARFSGDPVVPKLEMMKASALGRLKGIKAYKEALNYVSLNYPASDEGKQAGVLLKTTIKTLEGQKFNTEEKEGEKWKWVFPIDGNNAVILQEFKNELQKRIDTPEGNKNLTFSTDVYNEHTYFMVIHGFTGKAELAAFKKAMAEKEKITVPENGFFITSENYSILQIHKNLDLYNKPTLP